MFNLSCDFIVKGLSVVSIHACGKRFFVENKIEPKNVNVIVYYHNKNIAFIKKENDKI